MASATIVGWQFWKGGSPQTGGWSSVSTIACGKSSNDWVGGVKFTLPGNASQITITARTYRLLQAGQQVACLRSSELSSPTSASLTASAYFTPAAAGSVTSIVINQTLSAGTYYLYLGGGSNCYADIYASGYMTIEYTPGCTHMCELFCEECEGAACQSCETYCESYCQTGCQTACQYGCEVTCETGCQVSCQSSCESSCQSCLGVCQTGCQVSCQNCEGACESGCEVASQRPSNWTWSSTVASGATVGTYNGAPAYLTAKEWNNFTARINSFRTYKKLSTVSFTSAASGSSMTAAQVNAARTAISAMSPPTSVPSAVSQGQAITAAFINGLSNSLNSIA